MGKTSERENANSDKGKSLCRPTVDSLEQYTTSEKEMEERRADMGLTIFRAHDHLFCEESARRRDWEQRKR
jgi:hypothetical protein